ncbi:MAG: hypothetical protein R2788_17930 [Saprospiraceae bacterium]
MSGSPAGFATDVYFYEFGGEVYAVSTGPPSEVWQVDLNDPGSSFFVQGFSLPNGSFLSKATSVGNEVFFTDVFWLYSYDPTSNTYQQECNAFAMGLNGFDGLTFLPPGTPPFPCLCTTDAGTVNNTADEICLPDIATVPFNNDEELDSDDLLQYILFSDLADTLGSILVTSNTPTIAFNLATMQTGVTYYLAHHRRGQLKRQCGPERRLPEHLQCLGGDLQAAAFCFLCHSQPQYLRRSVHYLECFLGWDAPF